MSTVSLLISSLALQALPPAWWSEGSPPVISGAPQANKGAANIGQAKWMAYRALATLRSQAPVLAAEVEGDLVGPGRPISSWDAPATPENALLQHAPLLTGQLKAIAAPFYTRIHAAAETWLATQRTINGTETGDGYFPWTTTDTSDDNHKALATIGQLKAVFALPLTEDADADGMSDFRESVLDGGTQGPDTDGDTLTDSEELLLGSSIYLADTDGDGTDDGATHASGGNPAGSGNDTDGDGEPDNVLYSVAFEVKQETHSMLPGIGYEAYGAADNLHRYLTRTFTEKYSVSGSPSYSSVTNGQHVTTFTYLEGGAITEDGEPVSSAQGTTFGDWKSTHGTPLGQGETLQRDTKVTNVTGPTTTATQVKTVTTETTPWTVKKNGSVVRSGTEVITTTEQYDLSDKKTYQEFWNTYVKPLAWEEDAPVPTYGPLEWVDYNRAVFGDAVAAEHVRDYFRNGDFMIFGNVSSPGMAYQDYGADTRLKSLRWRWIKFNPANPFDYEYATPPASVRKAFYLQVRQTDYLDTREWNENGPITDETVGKGIVEIDCTPTEGTTDWATVPLTEFASYKIEDPVELANLDFSKRGHSQVWFGNLPVSIQKRIPSIADGSGPTTYSYQQVASVPRETPLPGVEITAKTISGDQLTLTAKIYDALADVAGSTPKVWVNSREQDPTSGDKPGVFRLQNHAYQLFPGRNEVTIAVENSLGGRGSETLVVEGGGNQGYQFAAEPVRTPRYPTYPAILQIREGYEDLPDDRSITLSVAGKSVTLARDTGDSSTPGHWFRSTPFLSMLKPPGATAAQVAALPSTKPLYLPTLEANFTVNVESSEWTAPEWTLNQSGIELVTPKSVEILETDELAPSLQFKARGLGAAPSIKAALTTYKGEEAEQNVTGSFTTAYQSAYGALAANAKRNAMTFTVSGFTLKEGFNLVNFDFTNSRAVRHGGSQQSFRFPEPEKNGVRVFSANRKKEVVLDGVTARSQEVWYPVGEDADLPDLADSLIASGCQVVGMTDINGCFEDEPLKRSFLVRGPVGRTFQAFDQLYAAEGRPQRAQTFSAEGSSGAALAAELGRVQTDDDLPASARSALGLEIAKTYQFHNGFEDHVPKTQQSYVDPGDGSQQPNSWTMRGSSLPDHLESNPLPWTVTSTVTNAARATSLAGLIKIDTTGENTAYYARTAAAAPWNLTGGRAVSLRFKLLAHDAVNGPNGAFQLAAGDGTRTWTCQVAPAQVKIHGTTLTLPSAIFPTGLADGKFHTLQFNLPGTTNDAVVSIDGHVLSVATAPQSGTLNGIAFGDPGAGIAGKFEVETLHFENSDLMYQYGYYDSDSYADSDEVDGANNMLLYLRSKGQMFRTSAIARWVKILDPDVYEWLLVTYTGERWDGAEKELHILTDRDVWLGSTVDVDSEEETEGFFFPKTTKVTNTIQIDKEETKVWSTDKTRNDMQLAGILMTWCYEQHDYKVWLAEREGGGTGIDGLLIEKKHFVENIAKCAKRVETTIRVGGEIVISMTNEYADYAITIASVSQGDYMAMVGFIPLVPSSTAKTFRLIEKEEGTLIEAIHQLSTKLDDFPGGKVTWPDEKNKSWVLDYDNLFANADDATAVSRARGLTTDDLIEGAGSMKGRKLLSTFSNSNVTVFKTKEPLRVYRCYSSNPAISPYGASGGFMLFEKPQNLRQVLADYALGDVDGPFLKYPPGHPRAGEAAYDRFVEIEIPADQYVYMGFVGKQTDEFIGGGTQIWVPDTVRDSMDWNSAHASASILPE